MIATTATGNNEFVGVVHRFHKRESCVFHSIHRFPRDFDSLRNEPLTCDDGSVERMFDRANAGQTAMADRVRGLCTVSIDTAHQARI
jgi:hypothetical protein